MSDPNDTSTGVRDHQVKCFNPDCNAIFNSVNEMVAVQGRGERCPRHFCESCSQEIREGGDRSINSEKQ
jgi:hypothetical protein